MRTSRYLWINNLPPKVTEEEIRESLISHGKIHNVKIHEVADSKGAVVAFFDQTGATKAIESSNKIDGVTLKIEYCDLNGTPGLQRLQQQQQQQIQQCTQVQNCDKSSDWVDERGNRSKSPLESHRNRSRSSSLSSTRSGRSNLTDVSKHGSSSRRDRNYQKASVDHVRRKVEKSDRERDHDENSQESGGESPPRFGEMRGLKVSQLPQRSSDSNIKEGLFHDLKRFGKITSVEVKGDDPSNRCAIVTFKRAEDAEKAYLKWNDKVYFFTNVVVERHPGTDKEDPSFCQPEQVLNEFHPKSTKTLFVGNLHQDPDSPNAKQELIDVFEEFGSILEVDIKKQPNQSGVAYAFIQYADINSVVRALHKAESIKIGGKPVKLGFGKSQPTPCLWLSNLPSGTTDGFLANHFKRYGPVKYITLHPQQLRALVYFESVDSAQKALSEQKNRIIAGRKLQADYASIRCQRHLLDQICQLTTYHMRSHPIADALRLAYSHAYMRTSYYHHYIRNFARNDDPRSRSRHLEDMDLYDPYVDASRRGPNDYEAYSARRSGGSSTVGGSNYPESGASGFGIEGGNSRNSLCGGSSSKKCSDRSSVSKPNGPSSEPHYSRNRSDSPFSSKSSHSRDLRSRSRSPRVDRKHRDSANRSHNRSDSSHSGEGEASADSSRQQRVIRRRRSTTRGSHSLSAGVGNSSDNLPSTRSSGQSSSNCLRREHRGPSTSTRTSRIQRLKSEVKPAASTSSSRAPTRRVGNASDEDGDSDVETPVIAAGTNVSALPSGHSGTGDSSSIHSGGSGGHRSDDATDIGELIAQREKLLREIIEMDGDASTISSSSARTVSSDNHRAKPILREIVDPSHHDKLKTSQELNLPSDTRKSKEKGDDPVVSRTPGNDEEHECKDASIKRRHTDTSIPSRLSNGPLSKSVSVTVPPLSSGFPSDTSHSPGQSKSDGDNPFKVLHSSPKDGPTPLEARVPTSGATSSTYQFHKVHPVSLSFDAKSHPSHRTLQHSSKFDQCADQSRSTVNDCASSNSERKPLTSAVTSCVNASRDPRLATQQYGNRLVGGNIPHSKVDSVRTSSSPTSTSVANSSSHQHHESSTERLTDLLQRFVQPVTAMAPTIAGQMDKVNSSRLPGANDACSPPPPPPPPPPLSRHGMDMTVVMDPHPHPHSLSKGPTSEKQTVYHDDSSTLADCEDPELKSVMQKTSTIDRQIQELDMKISRSEIARATAPTIDLSKYRIRPRSESSKSASATVRPTGGAPAAAETSAPAYSSVTLSCDKPSQWKEESVTSNATEFIEQSAPNVKSQDTSEFVKSMLMQSSRNSSFFMSNSAPVQNPGVNTASTPAIPTTSTVSPPMMNSAPNTNTVSSPWTSSPSCEDLHQPVSTSTSVINRLNSPPIVASSLGPPSVTNVTYYNRVPSSSSNPVATSHSVTSRATGAVQSTTKTLGITTNSSSVTVNSSNSNYRPPRLSSVSYSGESNPDSGTHSTTQDAPAISPRSPEHLKSILKKDPAVDVKPSAIRSAVSPTSNKCSFPENCALTVKNAVTTPLPTVSSSGQKPQRSPLGTPKPSLVSMEGKSTLSVGLKRKHSSDDSVKKQCKVLKLELESDGNLFRPDSFLFANKSDVKKEKRASEQMKRPKLSISCENNEEKSVSPVDELKSSPQLSNSSHDELRIKKDDLEEKARDRKFAVDFNDSISKKRKPKEKSIESSDTTSKVDDSDDESKHDSKRKRKKKVNRSKDDFQRMEKKEKRKKRKKLDQNQILKKKTREKLKETEDKLKKLKQRKRTNDGKDSCDISESIDKQTKKEKVDRKCSNDESITDDESQSKVCTSKFVSMYDIVKSNKRQLQNQDHSKDMKKTSKAVRRKSGENFKKCLFDSGDNSVDESESRASSSKSVITRKGKGKSSKKRRKAFNNSNLTSDESDEREVNSIMNKMGSSSKGSNRFRLNSDEADDDTDYEDLRKSSAKSGKKKTEKKKSAESMLTKKSKKSKVSSEIKKKKAYIQDEVKKRRKKSSANNKVDMGDSGKQKMSVASVFSDVDTDSSTGTDYRLRYDTKIPTDIPAEESDESQVSEDGLTMLNTPKTRLVRQRTAASSPTTPSTEPMSDDAVMTDLSLSGLTPFPEKNKNPLKEALTSAHEESRKELKELQRESGILSERHRADDDVEVSEDLPSLEVMTGIVKSPSSIDDEPPAITCNDAPTLTTDAEADDRGSIIEETVIEEQCLDAPFYPTRPCVEETSDKDESAGESYASVASSRSPSSDEDEVENVELSRGASPEINKRVNAFSVDSLPVSSSQEIPSTAIKKQLLEPANELKLNIKTEEFKGKKEVEVKSEVPESKPDVIDESSDVDSKCSPFLASVSNCLVNKMNFSSEAANQEVKSETTFTPSTGKPLATVFPVEQTKAASDTPVLELPTKSHGPPEISKFETEDNPESVKNSNETGNKVEMVRYVQRIMERVSVDICEDNKGPGKRMKKGSGGLTCSSGTTHSNQNILTSIADRGLSDRKHMSSTTANPACLVPPGCNIYLEDSKMLPNLPASVTLTAPILNSSCQPPTTVSGQTSQQPAVAVISSPGGLKGVTVSVSAPVSRIPPAQPSPNVAGSVINAPLTVSKANSLGVSVSNFNASLDSSQVSQESFSQSQSIQQAIATNSVVNSSPDGFNSNKSAAVHQTASTLETASSSNVGNFPYSRRVLSRRKRNSSSNTNSKSAADSDREGTWHAHVDEVLEKVVHGKSNSPNCDVSKSSQSASHMSVKMEDQLMQQKETDEAVRAIEMSMIRGGSSDSPEVNSNEVTSKKDVDPYEPNFDEPSPSEINRNILTHSHHKRQDGINALPSSIEVEDHRVSNTSRPVFESLLADASEKPQIHQTQGKPMVEVAMETDTVQGIKTDGMKCGSEKLDLEGKLDKTKDDTSAVDLEKSGDRSTETSSSHIANVSDKSDLSLKAQPNDTDAEVPVGVKCTSVTSIPQEMKDVPNVLKSQDEMKRDDEKMNVMKQSLQSSEEFQSLKNYEHLDRVKIEQHNRTPPHGKGQISVSQQQLIQFAHQSQQPQLAQFNLQKQHADVPKQLVKNQPQTQSHLAGPTLGQSPQQIPQPVFMQTQLSQNQDQQPQLSQSQIQQIQQSYQFQQKTVNFPHILQQKNIIQSAKQAEQIIDSLKGSPMMPSKLIDSSSNSSDVMTTSDAVVLSKDSLNAGGGSGTRKRTNRAMSQTALTHVEEILDAVAHDQKFDLTQYSKDSSTRRRSNSGEDHFPQPPNAMVPPVLKDGAGLFTTTDLRVLTPRSANAMVSSKVGAEEQVQVQATLAQPQTSGASVQSKVSIAPLVLGQFIKHSGPNIQSQQFKQTRPASAVGVNDAANVNNAPLIATVEPVFQQLALTTSFASLPPSGASISPALATSGISSKLAALATPLQSIETSKIVHSSNAAGSSRHPTNLPQPAVTPTTQTCCTTTTNQIIGTPLSGSQPFAVAQATATVEDRGHAIERIPNPGLAAVHHRDQISPRLPAVSSSTSPGTTNVALDAKSSNPSNAALVNPVTGIVSSVGSRPSSNPVHLQASNVTDSVPTSHQARNFLPAGMGFEHNYDFQLQLAAMQLMRQNTQHLHSDSNLMEILSMHYLTSHLNSSNSNAPHQFWPNSERRDTHASATNPIIPGVSVQGIPQAGLPSKSSLGAAPDWSLEQLHDLQAKYHVSWKGKLALKNDEVLVQMLFINGNMALVNNCIKMLSGSLGGAAVPPLQQALKIVQRMRMEQSQLEGVVRKMEEDHCMLLAVPTGEDINEMETQANVLSSSFIKYLQEKTAAGIINVNHAESQQPAYVVHIFPPGEFSRQRLSSVSSELVGACGELPHLLVIITTV